MAEPAYTSTPTDDDVDAQSSDDEALLRTARARFERSVEAETELREQFAIDQRYRAGLQWPDHVQQERTVDQRPALIVNLIPGAIAQVTNEQRSNPATLRVSAIGDGATEEVAKICDGLLRHIQRDSRADIAYETASDEAAGPGRGWFRLITEYESPTSFAQKLTILSIPNALTVYPQPNLREPDYSDMHWCFVVDDVPHDEFLALYPRMTPHEMDAWAAEGSDPWITKDTVRVAEYFYKEYEAHHLALLSDRTVIDLTLDGSTLAALQAHLVASARAAARPPLTVIDTRTAQRPVVWWTKLNGLQVLERQRWLGSWIPIIPVLGDRFYVDGQVRLSGLIRDSRDSQCMINYWESARTETIALAPRAPWLAPKGSFEGFEGQWETANTRNHAYLEYNPVFEKQTLMPAPTRNVQEPAIQALNVACQSAKDNFQATTRIYDASYGAPSNERSGKAIQARDQNSDMSNAHYSSNRRRSLHHAGRLLLELLPKIYDEPGRVLRIVHEDGTEKQVTVNLKHIDPETQLERFYDLTSGTYDVAVDAGPSYERQRQDGIADMVAMAKVDPAIMATSDDLVIGSMGFPGAKDIAKRLKKGKDPALLDEDGADAETRLAQAQGQLQQVSEQAQALNAHAGEVEQAHQATLQECQQLQQQLAQAKAQDQDSQRDHADKQRELAQRETEDQRQAALDAGKLALDKAKLDLEVDKLLLAREQAQHTMHAERVALQPAIDAQAQQTGLADLATMQAQLLQTQQQVSASLALLAQAEAERAAPKTIALHRDASGALVGEVIDASGAVVRRLALARTGTGYHGEVA